LGFLTKNFFTLRAMSIDRVSAQVVWNEVKALLRKELGEKRFSLWLGRSRIVEATEDRIVIGLPNAFMVTMVSSMLQERIRNALRDSLAGDVDLKFVVDAELFREYRRSESIPQVREDDWPSEFSLLLDNRFVFENFIAGSSNSLAYRCVVDAVKEPCSCGNPLILYGPSGSGKTHLLNALGIEARRTNPSSKIVFTTPHAFADSFYRAMRNGELMQFRKCMRNSDFLLIDDAHRLASFDKLHDEFLYTIEHHINSGTQVVAAFSRHPEVVFSDKRRLKSRFLSGMLARIELPEREVRRGIAEQVFNRLAEKFRRLLTPDAADFIADNFHGGAPVVLSAARQIAAYLTIEAAEKEEFVSSETLKNILGGLMKSRSRFALLASIREIVAEHFNISEDELASGSRKRYLSLPRNIFFYLARILTKESFTVLGEYMNRTHTAAHNGFKRIEEESQKNPQLASTIKQLFSRLQP